MTTSRLYPVEQAVLRAVISETLTGDRVIIAATPGRSIRVLDGAVFAAGSTTVTFRGDTAALTGAIPIASNGGTLLISGGGWGVFQTASGEELNTNSSNAVAVTGWINYILT